MLNQVTQKIKKGFQEVPIEIGRFVSHQYPDFITNNQLERLQDEVPVFMFHTIYPNLFKQQLEYLKINQYQTLDLKTFIAFLKGEVELKQPSVLITVDDGEKSWYEVAYPLLKEYGFHAVGFLVPFYIKEKPESAQGKSWLSWPEVIEMEKSGVFEFESHSYYHGKIFTEPKVIDFFNPDYPNSLGMQTPWINYQGSYTNQLPLGTPIYENAARLKGKRRYFDPPEIRETCINWVKDQGGVEVFKRSNWRQQLQRVYQEAQEQNELADYESEQEQKEQILLDLGPAKNHLSERLNKPIEHLCYPWGQGSELSVKLSQEIGYISNFWDSIPQRSTNQKGDSPLYTPRIKDDYLMRLPGAGRKPLWKIFKDKLNRRAKTIDLY
ncbi:Putative polysaccharide deacetylase YxkH [Planktothrix tepida]|uniref:Polysaccharide deacetylase family protein n=1 Tax=Planktothrix tepida PCC 9214 TaxID=671072 RepID=A0A1J1LRK9_9CYAN|nr:polysaccharide deacetylase family protein [Planktothrix tepida]CAD5972356.1 Putative polysaccharide deacetylase YxkH [Planktothrix tepida]CUR34484.1 Polysaccharide deacetylase family protein [Planktothrix tepida PCC 9214]